MFLTLPLLFGEAAPVIGEAIDGGLEEAGWG
jgi:hypothetical protein